MLHISTRASNSSGEQKTTESELIFAALDLGTNNCRLLVASPQTTDENSPASQAGKLRVFDSFSRVVRLGEGVTSTGFLSQEAMERTMIALKACQKKLNRYKLTDSRFVATEACRRAENGLEFLKNVRDETGMNIDIISTEDEATLAFNGCSSLLTNESQRAVVFDIGGGSTELMWVDVKNGKTITDWLSIGFGVMNLSDKFGGSNLADIAFSDMVNTLTERLRPFDITNQISKAIGSTNVQLLSTSGTVTTLAAIHLDLPRYDRSKIDGITLSVSDIRATTKRLLDMRQSERFNHPCIGPDRSDFILSGCAIFEAISTLWPTKNITIADRGVREGIILSLLEKQTT
ncbi:MAG: Ppx/GppA phosphatase family protein [Rickettsiales bacterium]|jgi:exopolyphosphatase/guanosine-5'-triphosphate,3'-diphosphate pyrophosphatase